MCVVERAVGQWAGGVEFWEGRGEGGGGRGEVVEAHLAGAARGGWSFCRWRLVDWTGGWMGLGWGLLLGGERGGICHVAFALLLSGEIGGATGLGRGIGGIRI